MFEKIFSMLGRQISHSVKDVVRSEEFQDLKNEVEDTFHGAFGGKSYTYRHKRNKRSRKRPEEPMADPMMPQVTPLRYSDPNFPWKQVASILLLVFGGLFGLVAALSVFGLLLSTITGMAMKMVFGVFLAGVVPFGAMSALMLGKGCKLRGRLSRLKLYLKCVGSANFCSIDQLAKMVRKEPEFVVKDLEKIIRTNMLPDGYLDDQRTCLMLGQETYQQYLQAQHSMEERERESSEKSTRDSSVVEKGRDQLHQIRLAKDFVKDDVLYLKITRLESVTEKILSYVEKHPEKESQIRKFNDYYLPTTLKLINSYCHFDMQPVQGENITTAKKQIRESLDTINTAFENLLDSLFGDVTLDISSDISVLEAMLAREGLTGNDFKKNEDAK